MRPRRIAFVVPRFGERVAGGAETLTRGFALQTVATGLAAVEVFTTCAINHHTWRNELPPGTTDDHGITVHRFKVDPPPFLSARSALRRPQFGAPCAWVSAYFVVPGCNRFARQNL